MFRLHLRGQQHILDNVLFKADKFLKIFMGVFRQTANIFVCSGAERGTTSVVLENYLVDPNPKDSGPRGPISGPSDAYNWNIQLIPYRLTQPTVLDIH